MYSVFKKLLGNGEGGGSNGNSKDTANSSYTLIIKTKDGPVEAEYRKGEIYFKSNDEKAAETAAYAIGRILFEYKKPEIISQQKKKEKEKIEQLKKEDNTGQKLMNYFMQESKNSNNVKPDETYVIREDEKTKSVILSPSKLNINWEDFVNAVNDLDEGLYKKELTSIKNYKKYFGNQ